MEVRARWSCKSLEAPQPMILPLLVLGNSNADSLDDKIKWIHPSGHENKTSRGVNCSNSSWVNVVSPVTFWSQHVTLELDWSCFLSLSLLCAGLFGKSLRVLLSGLSVFERFLARKRRQQICNYSLTTCIYLINAVRRWKKKTFIIHNLELKFCTRICKSKIKHAVQFQPLWRLVWRMH